MCNWVPISPHCLQQNLEEIGFTWGNLLGVRYQRRCIFLMISQWLTHLDSFETVWEASIQRMTGKDFCNSYSQRTILGHKTVGSSFSNSLYMRDIPFTLCIAFKKFLEGPRMGQFRWPLYSVHPISNLQILEEFRARNFIFIIQRSKFAQTIICI